MRTLETAWRWVIGAAAWGSGVTICVMMVLITTEVVLRKFFNFSIVGTVEIVAALLVIAVFLAWSYTQSQNGHVKVEFVVARFGHKTRLVLETIITLVMVGIFSILTWQTMLYALEARHFALLYETARLPVFPVRLMVPVGCFFFCLQLLQRLASGMARLLPTSRTHLSDN